MTGLITTILIVLFLVSLLVPYLPGDRLPGWVRRGVAKSRPWLGGAVLGWLLRRRVEKRTSDDTPTVPEGPRAAQAREDAAAAGARAEEATARAEGRAVAVAERKTEDVEPDEVVRRLNEHLRRKP